MKQLFIVKENHPTLLLFFAGWGADETPFKAYRPAGSDFMICYDYRSLDFDASLLSGYRDMTVLGWSMGVWAATQTLGGLSAAGVPLPPCRVSCAVNGTPYPVDNALGIPASVYHGTIEGLSGASLNKFLRRMCGSAEAYRAFLAVTPRRPLDELGEELRAIEQTAADAAPGYFKWNRAVIGADDRIIPPENQERAWRQYQTARPDLLDAYEVDQHLPHYSRELFQMLIGMGI